MIVHTLKFIPGNPPRTPIHFLVSAWVRANDPHVEAFIRKHLEEHFLSESMLASIPSGIVKYVIRFKDHSEGAAAMWRDAHKYYMGQEEIAKSKLRSLRNKSVEANSMEEFELVTL